MKEADRKQRNADKVKELYPTFRTKIEQVIVEMEKRGFRPRIQDAYRSPADQLIAFNNGHSKLKYGFHNVTGASGQHESLAVDMIDDDFPLASRPSYLLNLADVSIGLGLHTGIDWGLTHELAVSVKTAIVNKNFNAPVKIGWDPTHIEPLGITPDQAHTGKRP